MAANPEDIELGDEDIDMDDDTEMPVQAKVPVSPCFRSYFSRPFLAVQCWAQVPPVVVSKFPEIGLCLLFSSSLYDNYYYHTL